MKIRVYTSKSGACMFAPNLFKSTSSNTKLVLMKIDDFLSCARRIAGGPLSKQKAARVRSLSEAGIQFDKLPYLRIVDHKKGVKVVGHEGRHRSMLLRELGYTHVPVLLKHQEHDIDDLPSTIVGEHNNVVQPNYSYIDYDFPQPFQSYD